MADDSEMTDIQMEDAILASLDRLHAFEKWLMAQKHEAQRAVAAPNKAIVAKMASLVSRLDAIKNS